MSWDAIVIGAGTNGLTAAAALAKAGRRVLVLERADAVGGTTRALEFAPGFRAAPLGRDPGWLPPAVARGLGLRGAGPAPVDVPLTVAAAPGAFLALAAHPGRAAEAIRRYAPDDAAAWPDFTSRVSALAGFLGRLYQRPAPDVAVTAPREVLSMAGLALAFRRLGRENMTELLRTLPMSVREWLDDTFTAEPLRAAIAGGGVMHLRQGPRSGGTAFVLLHQLVGAPPGAMRRAGWWEGDAAGLCGVLAGVARQHGVTMRTGADVRRITVADDAVTGVVLAGGEEIAAPVVLSSADATRTLRGLVDPVWLDPEFLHAVGNIRYRGCAAVVLYALDTLPEFPGFDEPRALGGVVSLTPALDDLERAADAAKYGAISPRPHVEITVPTLARPGNAPEGRHVLLAHVQYAPYGLTDDARWDAGRRDALADRVTEAIACVAPGFADRVLHRRVLAPPDLEAEFGVTEGAVTHGELALDQIIFMRPVAGWGRSATPVAGLYLCGAATHPGPGVRGGAGWLAARRVLADAAR